MYDTIISEYLCDHCGEPLTTGAIHAKMMEWKRRAQSAEAQRDHLAASIDEATAALDGPIIDTDHEVYDPEFQDFFALTINAPDRIDRIKQLRDMFDHQRRLLTRALRKAKDAHDMLAHQDRKIAHGCTDAYCPECDA